MWRFFGAMFSQPGVLIRFQCDKNARQRSRLPSHFAVAETTESPLGLGPTALGPSGRNRNGSLVRVVVIATEPLPSHFVVY